ncbi:MAG: PhzF family phenazine biosynthesis protein [Gemmatimonadota bacterium]
MKAGPQPIVQVDAFTDKPFAGNPAAVCIMDRAAPESWMQNVAREMNLAETAFLHRENDGYLLRWFTPAVEVKLCGHATLASAHVLWQEGHLQPDQQARFHTLSGLLTADREDDWIRLDFPAKFAQAADAPAGLFESLGLKSAAFVGKNEFDYLVEVDSDDVVKSIAPDFNQLTRVEARGVIVTARSSSEQYDFVSRFFAPRVGVPEDPVTGSAHCCLAPHWGDKLGKDELLGYQASERGGVVKVRVEGERVLLYGQAVTVLTGELHVPSAPRA